MQPAVVNYIAFAVSVLLPAAVTLLLVKSEGKPRYANIKPGVKRLVTGVLFGFASVLASAWGLGLDLNVQEAAPLTAALLFGAPSGIIACAVCALIQAATADVPFGSYIAVLVFAIMAAAVLISAALKRVIFGKQRPGVFGALAIALGIETLYELSVIFISSSNIRLIFTSLRQTTLPTVILNAAAVALAAFAARGAGGRALKKGSTLSSQFQTGLLILTVAAFTVTTLLTNSILTQISENDAADLLRINIEDSGDDVQNRDVGENGYMLIADNNGVIISAGAGQTGKSLYDAGLNAGNMPLDTLFTADVYGTPCYVMAQKSGPAFKIAVIPIEEAVFSRDISLYLLSGLNIVVFLLLFALAYMLINKLVVAKMERINSGLEQITGGDLDVIINAGGSLEFSGLSGGINTTVSALKRYIAEAKARIDQELQNAKEIQRSALPNVFPPFPERHEFEIYAIMDAAADVGGDFYDFYLLGDKLAFLVADVSGKGIPAAMFMMKAKTQLKSLAERGCRLQQVFELANGKLYDDNDAAMFVTAWMGLLDVNTGALEFVNAGHNYPLLKRKGGKFEYLKMRSGLFLAADEKLTYKKYELQLEPGDEILLYTDGVTEATNKNLELYGENRLSEFVNSKNYSTMEALCRAVVEDALKFTADAPQFDDITVLALKFNGTKNNG